MNNDVNNNQPEKDLKNNKKNSFQGIGKWLLSLLLAAWMFVLGVIVGRETVPVSMDKTEQLQEELVRLKKEEQEQEVEQYQMEMDRLNEEQPELDFHVILKEMEQEELLQQQGMGDTARRADRDTSEKNGRIPEKTALITKRSSKQSDTGSVRSENGSRRKSAATHSTTEKPRFNEHTPAVAARVVYAKNGKITIQVASFGDKDDALRVVSSLKKKGYPAVIAIAKIVDKGIWYRVRVGSFNTRKDASAVVSRLKKQGFSPMIVNNK